MLRLVINVSKKIPGPIAFSSVQSSCSIESELASGQDPVAEAARLQIQAQQAVDQFLGIALASSSAPSVDTPVVPAPMAKSAPAPRANMPASNGTSQPYAGGRRAPAIISPAQLRFLRQLLDRTTGAADRILAEQRVASIEALTSRAASAIIDQLKEAAR